MITLVNTVIWWKLFLDENSCTYFDMFRRLITQRLRDGCVDKPDSPIYFSLPASFRRRHRRRCRQWQLYIREEKRREGKGREEKRRERRRVEQSRVEQSRVEQSRVETRVEKRIEEKREKRKEEKEERVRVAKRREERMF